MPKQFVHFIVADDGAVTVDWVVLTAALIGMGMVVITPIAYSTDNEAQGISDYISSIDVGDED